MKNTMPLMPAANPEKLAVYAELLQRYSGTASTMQCARLLGAMKRFPVTSYEAQKHLDVYDPPARINKLRESYQIETIRVQQQTDAGVIHKRIGMFVLRGKKVNHD